MLLPGYLQVFLTLPGSVIRLSSGIFIFFCAVIYAAAGDLIIRTPAGSGVYGFAGDTGAASNAFLATPTGIAVDADGNLYLADSYNNRIRKVTPLGIISTFAGTGIGGYTGDGGNATQAQIDTPTSVAVDRSGNVFFADSLNSAVRMIDTSGKISTVAGNGQDGFSGDNGNAKQARLFFPQAITVDDKGNLYISDTLNNRIRRVDTLGIITTIAGDGTAGYAGNGGAATLARLDTPQGIAVDRAGNIYISDTNNFVVRKIDKTGKISTIAGNGVDGYGGDNGAALQAQLGPIRGLTVDPAGNVLISDPGNDRIRRVDVNGMISTIAGNGATGYFGDGVNATQTALNEPVDVAIDPNGIIFIADSYNDRIRVLKNTQLQVFGLSQYLIPTSATGTTVRIFGAGFEGSTVTINGQSATGILNAASGNLDVTVPSSLLATFGVLQFKVSSSTTNGEKNAVVAAPAQISATGSTSVSAASYTRPLSPEAISSMFGNGLATQVIAAASVPLPTTLGGTRIFVNGTAAPLFYVSPTQVNYQLPLQANTNLNTTILTVSGSGIVSQERLQLNGEAPGIFTASSDGNGGPAAFWTADGIVNNRVTNPDGSLSPIPANTYLILFGTGIRRAPDLNPNNTNGVAEVTTANFGNLTAPVDYAGVQGYYVGLDQINVQIPVSLTGKGQTALTINVNGKLTNTVQIKIQ